MKHILLWPPFGLSAMWHELVTCWFNYHFQVQAPNLAKSFVRKLHPFLNYCPIIPLYILCLKCTLAWHCDPHFLSCAHPSFAMILKSTWFATVPLRHLLTTCDLPHILLLTNLPAVLWWTSGKSLQWRGGLSNVDSCIVSDRRTCSSCASTDILLSIDFLFARFWMVGFCESLWRCIWKYGIDGTCGWWQVQGQL